MKSGPERGAARAGRAAALVLLGIAGWAPTAGAQDGRQLFWLPESADAGQLAQELEGHIEQGRWERAIDVAQGLLEGLHGDVLPERRDPDRPSQSSHHLGVAHWAREALTGMPRPGLEAYERRFGRDAQTAFERAAAAADGSALLSVAARYPASRAARRALWAAGDIAFAQGHLSDAEHCWRRAHEGSPGDERESAELALQLRLEAASEAGADRAPSSTSFRLPGPGEAPGPVPSEIDESWIVELPEHPFTPRRSTQGPANLVPLVHADFVYVNTTLEVLAFDAFSGELRWRSDQPPGWEGLDSDVRDELAEGVDRESQLIAPAAGSGVVVAALQVPFARLPSADYQGFVITVPLPDRRLFAFDAQTGEPLWNHAPPAGWDGNSGSFVERMSVVGSPVVAGSRVLVPMGRMDGRIDLHLASFDLAEGSLLWSTPIVSGQRELNMFNRHEREFSAPPVRVEGDTVLLLTQLGSVAAVDLLTGDTRWQATYDQLPLPETRGLISVERELYWKNAPVVVAEDVVLATPLDADSLFAFDLADGRVLWSARRDDLTPGRRSGSGAVDVLLGAEERGVVLGGGWIADWRKPQGLDSWSPLVPGGLRVELGTDLATSRHAAREAPRPTLGSDRILVSGREGLLFVDRDTGRLEHGRGIAWAQDERGNLSVGSGALFVASNRSLRGLLDLGVLEARARERAEADPRDVEAAVELARLLGRRGDLHAKDGRTSDALEALARAGEVLEPLLSDDRARARRIALLEQEANVRRAAGSTASALECLERGLALTDRPEEVRDLRLAQLPLLRGVSPLAYAEALEDLATRAGRTTIAPDRLASDAAWVGFLGGLDEQPERVEVDAWVAVQRALQAEAKGRFADALEDWQRVLDLHFDRRANRATTLGELATARVGRLVDLGGEQLYAPWAERARIELERALALGDDAALRALARRYPFAPTALDSRRALAERALVRGDLDELASVAQELGATTDDPDERARLDLMLAAALGGVGNGEAELRLTERVARMRPDLALEIGPTAGRTASALLRELAARRPRPAGSADFGRELESVGRLDGEFRILGQPPLAGNEPSPEAPRPVVLVRGGRLEAYPAEGGAEPLWSTPLPLTVVPTEREELWTLTSSHAVAGAVDRLVGVELGSGRLAWELSLDDLLVVSVRAGDGLVTATVVDDRGSGATSLIGIEPNRGSVLWRCALPPAYGWWPAISGEGRLAVLATDLDGSNRAAVLDPFTGELRGIVEVPDRLGTRADRLPWIESDRLILPSLYTQRLTAIDLASLEVAWTYQVDERRDLQALIHVGDKLYLETAPKTLSDRGVRGALIELDPRLGSYRTVVELERAEHLVGVAPRERTRLDSPYVLLVGPGGSADASDRMRLTAVDLTRGRRWWQELDLREEQFYGADWARYAVSRTSVALIHAQRLRRGGDRHRAWLDVFDLENGARRQHLELREGYTGFDMLELHAIGPMLWIGGHGARGVADRIDLWSDR